MFDAAGQIRVWLVRDIVALDPELVPWPLGDPWVVCKRAGKPEVARRSALPCRRGVRTSNPCLRGEALSLVICSDSRPPGRTPWGTGEQPAMAGVYPAHTGPGPFQGREAGSSHVPGSRCGRRFRTCPRLRRRPGLNRSRFPSRGTAPSRGMPPSRCTSPTDPGTPGPPFQGRRARSCVRSGEGTRPRDQRQGRATRAELTTSSQGCISTSGVKPSRSSGETDG